MTLSRAQIQTMRLLRENRSMRLVDLSQARGVLAGPQVRVMEALRDRGLVQRSKIGTWRLTPVGTSLLREVH